MVALVCVPALAQNLPSSADPGRIKPLERPVMPSQPLAKPTIPEMRSGTTIPDAAKGITFQLEQVRLEGVTVFTESELEDIYQPYLGEKTSLEVVWLIAGQITERYRNQGYFLSRAYVPAQEIEDGVITINIVEGHIGEVALDDPLREQFVVKRLISRLTAQQPVSAYALESFMLQLNALPGKEFRAFVEPLEQAGDGAVKLSLRPAEEAGSGSITLDNAGSRFLGPYQATVTYQDSFLPLQQTTLSALSSVPTDEMQYAAFRHEAPIAPDWKLELSGNYVTARPGASLAPNDIKSNSVELGIGVSWQPIRQFQENLVVSLELTGKNSNGDILDNNPLTRDRIRVARGSIRYDKADSWNGYNSLTLGVNRGLELLGASKEGDLNLSRAEAEPDFTTAQLSYTRQQAINSSFTAIGQLSGQIASGPLFSAEEFGYGGQGFGRAYDPSEITGDHGIAASLELRYLGLDPWQEIAFTPYGFYDIGKVWNEDSGGTDESAASAGLGLRLNHGSGINGNVGVAWPLTREISTPIYGNGKNSRLLLQLGYGF